MVVQAGLIIVCVKKPARKVSVLDACSKEIGLVSLCNIDRENTKASIFGDTRTPATILGTFLFGAKPKTSTLNCVT